MYVEVPPPQSRSIHLVHGAHNRKITRTAMFAGLGVVVVALGGLYVLCGELDNFLIACATIFSGYVLIMSSVSLVSLVYMQRESGIGDELLPAVPNGPSAETFAVLIPARHETDVLAETLLNTMWTQRDHPAHTVFAIVNDDDPDTAGVAARTATVVNLAVAQDRSYEQIRSELHTALAREAAPERDPNRLAATVPPGPLQLIVYPLGNRPPNKPQQLNYAFWRLHESFSVFTVLDAESIAAPGLLRAVDQAFQDHPGVEIIQGGIQLMDPQITGSRWQRIGRRLHRWYAWHNLLEYKRWFSSQMRYQSDRGFMPLGGNTIFLRAQLLARTEAWPMSLTEDCELGVRATAIHRARTLTFYDPRLTTREETPPSLATLIKQRRRWNIGFLQSLVAGNWRSLPTLRQRVIAAQILSMSLFQALSLAVLPLVLVTMFWIDTPAPLAVAGWIPLVPIALSVALQLLHLREYSRGFGRRVPWYVYVLFVVTFFPYQLVLSFAAVQAMVWYGLGRLGWDKTAHVGDHFEEQVAAEAAA
ncbi:glycosyltransferase [Nocardia stercoris]|uniref:Glycosyltransferase family 2 protein n=1 Tax=Nocardia stercoris TaxID=2483361 RepID=A0A3M2LAW7_9NOCA|nr:glycosyltransferase family 2 protein [Nocardia stercoris]RMI31758.1 glycosyltransferase family 2 protein [Nocardia stercoris]